MTETGFETPQNRCYDKRMMHTREEAIFCPICGWGPRHNLTQHVIHHHGLTASEFRAQYPDVPLTSEHLRAVLVDLMEDRLVEGWKGPNVRWDRESILRALRRYKAVPSKEVWGQEHRKPSVPTLALHFGSWSAAWKAAGFTPRRRGRPPVPTCGKGHLKGRNLVTRADGRRVCRACTRRRNREARARRKAAA